MGAVESGSAVMNVILPWHRFRTWMDSLALEKEKADRKSVV